MQQSPPGDLATFNRFVKTLWFALLVSVCLYWPMLGFLQINRDEPPPTTVLQALMFMAIGTVGAVLFVRFNRIAAILSRVPSDSATLAQLRTLYIICFVLAESVAFFGMVLYFLGGPREQALWFFLGSVALFLVCYPRTPEATPGLPPQ